jgi:hydrogenase expression/formation protein HypE
MDSEELNLDASCPIPITEYDRVLMAHGGGGRLSNQLIEKMFFSQFDNHLLEQAHDGAILNLNSGNIAFTTDSFVVHPIFFPGGNIGELAVNGTVNDLVCCGAKPLYLSLAFIIEEGLLMSDLWEITKSIKSAADKANVKIVTGDTKVVDKGKGDKIYINTTGVGEIYQNLNISPINCNVGDKIIINGSVADHGIAIMSKREGLEFETTIKSDTAALNGLMEPVFKKFKNIHVMRDPTRGGLASTLNEIANSSDCSITLFEENIPINEEVLGACEILGFDPLYIANEGKILVVVPEKDAEPILEIMKMHPFGKESAIIGEITDKEKAIVKLKTSIGSTRIVDMISGEQLPRIC